MYNSHGQCSRRSCCIRLQWIGVALLWACMGVGLALLWAWMWLNNYDGTAAAIAYINIVLIIACGCGALIAFGYAFTTDTPACPGCLSEPDPEEKKLPIN